MLSSLRDSSKLARRDCVGVIPNSVVVMPNATFVVLAAAFVILSAAKDLVTSTEFFAALSMTDSGKSKVTLG